MRHMLFSKSTLAFWVVLSTAVAYAEPAPATATTKRAPAKKARAVRSAPDLEPRAIALLKAASDRLAAAKSLSFTAVELLEQPSRHGHPLAYATRSEVVLQRPN